MPNATLDTIPVVYNNNGAIKYNFYNGIAGITYNVLNLPFTIQFMNGHSIQYYYDASGTKICTIYQIVRSSVNIPLGTTDYTPNSSDVLSTFATYYCSNGHIVYEGYSPLVLKRILNPEGYAEKQSDGTYSYYYYAKDHLGNNRAVFKASSTTFLGPGQEISYYPFGLPHAQVYAPEDGIENELQPYKFGGKEYDEMFGLNWYDFGARYYNGMTPMFMTMDPLAEKYPQQSPYVYCLNNPVNFIDQDGRQPIPIPMPVLPPPIPGTQRTTISPSDVRNAINSLRQAVRTTFEVASNFRLSVGSASVGGASILVVMPVAKPSPGKQEQDKRERNGKEKLDQNQANVEQKVVNGGHNPKDPGGEFNSNNPDPKTALKVVAGTVGGGLLLEQINANGDSEGQQQQSQQQQQQKPPQEQKPQQQDPSIWDRIKNFFK